MNTEKDSVRRWLVRVLGYWVHPAAVDSKRTTGIGWSEEAREAVIVDQEIGRAHV